MTENNCRTGTVTNDQSAIFIACAHRLDEVGSQYLAEELRSVQCDLLAASPVEQPPAEAAFSAGTCFCAGAAAAHGGSCVYVNGAPKCRQQPAAALIDELSAFQRATGCLTAKELLDKVIAEKTKQPAAAPIAYDGLSEEFTDEVARLAGDAPGIREAVWAALENCNAIIAPQGNAAPSPADERAAFPAWCDRFPEISSVERLREAWQAARAAPANETGAEGAKYEALEREHFGDADKRTGIYAPTAMAAEPVAWMVLAANTRKPCEVTLHKSETEALRQDCVVPLYAAPQPAQAGARVGLTDEQRDAIDFVIGWYEQSTIADNPYREHIAALRALLSARPAESWQVEIDAYKREVRELEAVLRIPEKIEDDWIRADVYSPTEAGIPHDDDVLAWNNDPGFATIISASFISPSFPEYTHWKKKPEAPADIDHSKGVDHAE